MGANLSLLSTPLLESHPNIWQVLPYSSDDLTVGEDEEMASLFDQKLTLFEEQTCFKSDCSSLVNLPEVLFEKISKFAVSSLGEYESLLCTNRFFYAHTTLWTSHLFQGNNVLVNNIIRLAKGNISRIPRRLWQAIELVAPVVQSLRLNFINFSSLRGPEVLQLFMHFRSVRELSLNGSDLSDSYLKKICSLLKLRRLDIGDNPRITVKGFYHLVSLENMEVLKLDHTNIPDNGLRFLSTLRKLGNLDINYCKKLSEMSMRYVSTLTNLHSLSLFKGKVSDVSVRFITRLPNLTKLSLEKCHNIRMLCQDFSSLRHLQELNVKGTFITNRALERIARLENLTTLLLDGCIQFTDFGFSKLVNLTRLKVLSAHATNITDFGLFSIALLKRLQKLFIGYNTKIGDMGVSSLRNLTNLDELDLCATVVTSVTLRSISKITTLTSLNLGSTAISDVDFHYIMKLKRLENLSIDDCADISDIGFASLSYLSNLKNLDIYETDITHAAIECHLVHCKKLETIRESDGCHKRLVPSAKSSNGR
jgi:Leucine-rich repeat (LRR) protein